MKTKKAKEIIEDYLYDISYYSYGSNCIIWRSISLCISASEVKNIYKDIEIITSTDTIGVNQWSDSNDLINHRNYKVICIGHKNKNPEYFL